MCCLWNWLLHSSLFICCYSFNSQKHLALFFLYMYLSPVQWLASMVFKTSSKGFGPVSAIVSLQLPFYMVWDLFYSNFIHQDFISFVTPCFSFILDLNFLESFLEILFCFLLTSVAILLVLYRRYDDTITCIGRVYLNAGKY